MNMLKRILLPVLLITRLFAGNFDGKSILRINGHQHELPDILVEQALE